MAPRRPDLRAPAIVPPDAPKVSKNKTQGTDKTIKKRTQKEPEPYRFKRYRNGLLNLERTPNRLEAVVKRNATESPLLKLPPEIRTTIWHFALSNELVRLPDHIYTEKGGAVRYTRDRDVDFKITDRYYFRHWACPRQSEDLASAFHLPEVCRQIYSEIALVAYSMSTFAFGTEYLRSRNGISSLKPVQRRAITSVELEPWGLGCCFRRPNYKLIKDTYFPNLERLIISKAALEYVKVLLRHEVGNLRDEEWKDHITRALRVREGSTVKVEFKDPDPSW
ncbi:hypothetical protein E8E13_007220 [Curvularia kusanoi]|uniref:DUF7730 domain-containing protein n=1 Tax=Curvularia kusanoi TaxID=90978 RepID=A0A9P4TE60_CURKU|nr:hypothetical protein E8E13_007220 [Curvularia kusanoi]